MLHSRPGKLVFWGQRSVCNLNGVMPTRLLNAGGLGYKKLCYGRGTARHTCRYRKACNWWMTLTYTQGHHSCCYQMTVWNISTCLWTVFQRLYLEPCADTTTFEVNVTACDLEQLLHFWRRSLSYKPRALSNLCVNIS